MNANKYSYTLCKTKTNNYKIFEYKYRQQQLSALRAIDENNSI